MIDPMTQQDGEDYMDYNRRRWGSDGWTYSLKERGKQLGLPFKGWKTWPNTFNAHRLCAYLEEIDALRDDLSDKQKEERRLTLMDKYFELTYERGVNISPMDGAAQALSELGFAETAEAIAWLEGGGGLDEVRRADTFAKTQMDISGVPFFVIRDAESAQKPVALNGAQSSAVFLDAFKRA
eukprot:gnl/TRDRNA2_/TRDRNA2_148652_c1_seq1.p2 gnl/TRDRNA2_/TRDRNA2_148652_c1~~gnl/TRDRNA2_/TRDRNA2_148652_c1_seq1.p2  ORF type:complete len:181 (-),score=39.11 gnl/TRDRNA2_/TRDRNA2_148652_c1_seq1:182-724(-)